MKNKMPLFAAALILTSVACSTYTSSTDPDDLGSGYALSEERVGTGHNASAGVAEANNNATLDNPATGVNSDSLAANQNPDQLFMMKAASGGLMEVAAGKLAATKAQNPEVKQFGQRMVTDHTKANTELKAIAAKKGVTLPTALLPEHQQHLDMLTQQSDAEFDRSYTQHMVEAHDKDIAEFQRQSTAGKDADLKAFAAKNLPVLQAHRKLIQPIYEKVNRGGSPEGATASGAATSGTTKKAGAQ
ncbi:DUF4142 domain-containing protein [Rufibacter latericius]|uniref:DUF4142 domain-containing protein n=1 Tax=Rufibacter latericius TaxID=2487040 RepID=A0A3M9MTZ3_9BACT|nr:DUF4142 domain-containing protein [Rufibacter latericius]RNI28655.1 DUF4142 domain-containing protein [Rufibacter latericius]